MRIGTRRSALALAQAQEVARLLGGRCASGYAELVPIVTSGDRGARGEDRSRWVRELEQALLDGEIDLAVHSAKDLPGDLADGLELLGVPARAPAEDVICGASGLAQLQAGARVGTSSVRRAAQLRAARADVEVVELRGNVDTRLRKLAGGEAGVRAIVLARAGLERLGRAAEAGGVLDPAAHVPAPGQGALALEGRADDETARAAARAITDEAALACVTAERALAAALGASCHTPLGAYASPTGAHASTPGGALELRAWVGLPDGSEWIADRLDGECASWRDEREPAALGRELARRMRLVGAEALLRHAEEMELERVGGA